MLDGYVLKVLKIIKKQSQHIFSFFIYFFINAMMMCQSCGIMITARFCFLLLILTWH